jgi:murein L,D-transpeptidase YafK
MRSFASLTVLAILLIAAGCGARLTPQPVRAERANPPQPSVVQNNSPLQLPLKSPRLVVQKAARKLLVYSNNKLVRTYRVGLGLSPVGDKVRSGDHRTPEGDYYVFTKNDKSAFYLSLGISYPNIGHAERGLRDGLITRAQYDAIVRANKAKKTPPQNTRLGGTIYIHGNGASSDWTWGCVALENSDIRELFNAVSVGTPVTIEP